MSYDPTTGNYNQFWMADREWDNRTSLITDPPDGQFPPLTAEAAGAARGRGGARARARAARRMVLKIDRCRSAASRTARREPAPITTATSRSSSRPTPSVLLQEMIHDARVVPMTPKPHLPEEHPPAARRSARPLGRRHAGRRDHELHQRFPGIDAGREAHRALHARQPRLHQLAGHRRGSRDVDQAVHVHDSLEEGRRTDLRIRLPRRQLRDGRHPRRRARAKRPRPGKAK